MATLHAALDDGRVRVRHVTADRAAVLREYEDEGAGVVYDVGDGRLLFLKGQWVQPEDETAPWPNTDFEIIQTVADDILIAINPRGRYIEPIRVIDPSDCRPDIVWSNRDELIENDLQTFAQSLIARNRD